MTFAKLGIGRSGAEKIEKASLWTQHVSPTWARNLSTIPEDKFKYKLSVNVVPSLQNIALLRHYQLQKLGINGLWRQLNLKQMEKQKHRSPKNKASLKKGNLRNRLLTQISGKMCSLKASVATTHCRFQKSGASTCSHQLISWLGDRWITWRVIYRYNNRV